MEWPQEGEGPCACRFVRREYMGKCEQIEWCGLHAKQRDELERLRALLRECRPHVMLHSPSGKPFDFPRELIDRVDAALMPANASFSGGPSGPSAASDSCTSKG